MGGGTARFGTQLGFGDPVLWGDARPGHGGGGGVRRLYAPCWGYPADTPPLCRRRCGLDHPAGPGAVWSASDLPARFLPRLGVPRGGGPADCVNQVTRVVSAAPGVTAAQSPGRGAGGPQTT